MAVKIQMERFRSGNKVGADAETKAFCAEIPLESAGYAGDNGLPHYRRCQNGKESRRLH